MGGWRAARAGGLAEARARDEGEQQQDMGSRGEAGRERRMKATSSRHGEPRGGRKKRGETVHVHVETGEMACSRRELPWLIDLKVLPSDMSITKKRGGTQYETDGATRGGKREYLRRRNPSPTRQTDHQSGASRGRRGESTCACPPIRRAAAARRAAWSAASTPSRGTAARTLETTWEAAGPLACSKHSGRCERAPSAAAARDNQPSLTAAS